MVAYLWRTFSSKHSLIYVVEAIQVGLKCCAQIFIPLEVWNVNDFFFSWMLFAVVRVELKSGTLAKLQSV